MPSLLCEISDKIPSTIEFWFFGIALAIGAAALAFTSRLTAVIMAGLTLTWALWMTYIGLIADEFRDAILGELGWGYFGHLIASGWLPFVASCVVLWQKRVPLGRGFPVQSAPESFRNPRYP